MISLNVEESLLDSYVKVDKQVKTFINSINSLENNLIKGESLNPIMLSIKPMIC